MIININNQQYSFPDVGEGEKFFFDKDEVLFNEREKNDYVYFLIEGRVKIIKSKCVLWEAITNEFIGVSSFFAEGDEFHFSAKACVRSVVYAFPVQSFKEMLSENALFSKYIMNMLCERIQLTNNRSNNLLTNTSKKRLIQEILKRLKESSSKTIEFTIEELSEMIGVSKKFVQSLLFELEKKNFIERMKNKLILKDVNGLKTELK